MTKSSTFEILHDLLERGFRVLDVSWWHEVDRRKTKGELYGYLENSRTGRAPLASGGRVAFRPFAGQHFLLKLLPLRFRENKVLRMFNILTEPLKDLWWYADTKSPHAVVLVNTSVAGNRSSWSTRCSLRRSVASTFHLPYEKCITSEALMEQIYRMVCAIAIWHKSELGGSWECFVLSPESLIYNSFSKAYKSSELK